MRTWGSTDLAGLLRGAAAEPAFAAVVDLDDPVFLPPGDMPERINRAAGLRDPEPAAVVRCILDSLAVAFAEAVSDAERLSGQPVEVVHLVGGGSQNALLCQLTADAAGRPVVAGPVEATALGNVLVQARTHGVLSGDLAALRGRVRAASRLHRYEPR
jgi:rhamnulokinase